MNGRRPQREGRILPVIRRVRRRWRLRILLRGLAAVLGTAFVAFLVSGWGVDALRFSPAAVTTLRVAAWGAVLGVAALVLVRPLLRRVSDRDVALYLEEHEPSLQSAILGAVELETADRPATGAPPALVRRMVERAVHRARAVEDGARIERRGLQRASGALAAVVAAALVFLALGPTSLRQGVTAVVNPTTAAAEVNPYSIAVVPGDSTVSRGSDQLVTARLQGFQAEDVVLLSAEGPGATARRLSMIPADDGSFEILLLNLQEDTEYRVEAAGIRSPTFTLDVEDLPYVDRMDHTYRFPAYTGMEPRVLEDGGDVAALRGTVVEIRVHPTLATPGGRILVDDEPAGDLVPGPDGTLRGELSVEAPGVYAIELARDDGTMVPASPEYTVDVLEDLPPSVTLTRPGRDTPASPIEEVYVEARADDDYGVADVRLVYAVNGGPEDTLAVFEGRGAPLTEVSAGHTFFLEEWPLEAGDVVAYHVVARDRRAGAAEEAVSDLFFIQIRPFGREYRQAEQQGGGGPPMGGGGGGPETALSELQRQVVTATFNLLRDREAYGEAEWEENLVSVALAQGRVQEQVATLAQRMRNRGLAGADPRFQEIAELLPEAVESMGEAEERLREGEPREALGPEQEALRILQKAEESYERFVGQQQQGGGGGGGGADADDLADLFELELDKLRNQYETVQRSEQRQASDEVDELLEKLEELARRQEQEAERQRQRAAQGQAGGSTADGQRALAEETEEAARRLERLARENRDPALQETARRLQEAAESMRRSAAESRTGQGTAQAGTASEQLEEARRRLRRAREERVGRTAQEALERMERLAEEQRRVQEELEEIAGTSDPARRAEEIRRLVERKEEMLGEVESLERELDRLASDARQEDPEASREVSEAAQAIRDTQLKEKIAWSRGVVQQRSDDDFAREFEEQIAQDLETVREQVEEASEAARGLAEDRGLEESLERTRDLVRGAESLGRRLESRAREEGPEGGGEEGQPGQGGEPQPGEPSGEGREGRTGDPGQAGQGGARGIPDSTAAANPTGGGGGQAEAGQPRGEATPGGGAVRGTPRPFTEEEIRQFRREFQERSQEARELRRELAREGEAVEDLDRAIEVMERLQQVETYRDLPAIPALQEELRQSLRRLEFVLRRQVEGEDAGQAALSGSDEVPAGYRELVEEYYRSLAREGSRGGGG